MGSISPPKKWYDVENMTFLFGRNRWRVYVFFTRNGVHGFEDNVKVWVLLKANVRTAGSQALVSLKSKPKDSRLLKVCLVEVTGWV